MRRRPTGAIILMMRRIGIMISRPQMVKGRTNIGATSSQMMRRGLNNYSDAQEVMMEWCTG